MTVIPIRIPSLMGGVSRVSMSQRSAIELEAMDNCDIDISRGVDKRAGTEHIDAAGTLGALDLVDPTNEMHFAWVNRDTDERFVICIDPGATSDLDVIQVFDLADGTEVLVEALASTGSDVALDDADTDVAEMLVYLKAGTQTPQQRFRTITVEDGTFILNRTVATALEGAAITYRDTATTSNVRQSTYAQNVTSWSKFTHPPVNVATFPTRAVLVTGGNIDEDAIWYAEDDSRGLFQGFYWAFSATQPSWFTRLPTEGANGFIKRDTMPLLLTFDGTKFVLKFAEWTARKSGDDSTNPGPAFIGSALDDISFHQGRLWFCSGENIVSSRAQDILNLWQNSVSLQVDADPITDSVQGTRVSIIRLMESFRESLILLTDGARQVELRANGPITPLSYQLFNSTDIFTANYVEPHRRGSQLYYAGERDASMLIWEYDYSPQQVSNVAFDLTRRVHGYIPAEAHLLTASNAHDQLFVLTLADTDAVYVNTGVFNQGERVLNSWFRWVYPDVDAVRTANVFDDWLYMLMERGGAMFLERQALGDPLQENDGSQTLGYALRFDRKVQIQGVYDAGDNETDFTLPYLDNTSSYQIVTGPSWDTATVKGAGTQFPVFSVATGGGGETVLTIEGDLENNADGVNAPCFIGVQFEAAAELSEVMVRDEDGTVLHGNNHLMRMRVRHRDSGGYSVRITPDGRDTFVHSFVVPSVGSTPLDSDQLDDFGEFPCRIMSHARNTRIELVNDTPFPTAWIDCEFTTTFVPTFSPVR